MASNSAMAPVSRPASKASPVALVSSSSAMVHGVLRRIALQRMALQVQPQQAGRAYQQPDAAHGARSTGALQNGYGAGSPRK